MQTGSRRSGRKRKHESSSSNEPDTVQGDSDPCHSKETAKKSADTGTQPTQAQASLKTPDESIVQEKKASDESDIPTYYETVPTLQNMSSIAAVIELWRQVIRTPDCEEESRFLGFGHNVKLCQHFVSKLAMPGLIRECVGNYLLRVLHEMEKWFQDYKKLLDEPLVTDILFCSWLSEGKIDYRASALNMLSNPRLTLDDKFKIMFRYCLEDEIKKSSVESLPTDFAENIDFESNPLMYYWLCYMKDDLDEIPKENEESIASRMIKVCDTWPAIEYFWHQLNDDERTSVLETILHRNPEFQKKLFSKMSEAQKTRIISDIPVKIMKNFWFEPGQEQFAFQTWVYIRNFVLDGQFEEIMKFITLHKRTAWDIEDKCRYLAEIWNHCPDHLKKLAYKAPIMNMILGNEVPRFLTDVFQGYECSYNGIEFITDYLSHFDTKVRKKLIFERPWVIVSFLDQSVTDHLIKLYLPDSKDKKAFKKIVLESNHIRTLVRKIMKQIDDFEAINKFMDVFCTNSRNRAEFAYDIISGFTDWSQIYSARGVPKHVKFTNFARQHVGGTLGSRISDSLSGRFEHIYLQYWREFSGPHH